MQLDVLISAGGYDVKQRHYKKIYEKTGIANKALIPLAGKPMIHYVLEAVDNADCVKSINIAGIDNLDFDFKKPVKYLMGGNTSFRTFISGLAYFNKMEKPPEYLMAISSDIPLLTSEMLERMVSEVKFTADAYLNLVLKKDFKKLYPNIFKIPLRTRQGVFVAGDVHIFKPKAIDIVGKTLEEIMDNRKNPFKVAKIFSFRHVIEYILCTLSIYELKERALKQFNVDVKGILTKFPEPAVDLDLARYIGEFERLCSRPKRKILPDEIVSIL